MSASRIRLLALGIAIVAAAVFLPALGGPWIFDDHMLIERNRFVHAFEPAQWLGHDFWSVLDDLGNTRGRMMYWRPLVSASYAADWGLGGGAPAMFHLTNMLAHGLAAAASFYTLRRWTGAVWPAALAAILFAIHPTKAESVAWISGRTDILCLGFVLLATAGIGRRLRGARGGLALEIAGTIAAYLCKEQAIVLPAFAAVEAWVAAGRPALDRRALVRMLRAALPQLAIAAAYVVARAVVLPVGNARDIGLADHALAVLETCGRLVALVVAPHDLSLQQGLIETRGGAMVHAAPYVALGGIAIAGVIAAIVLLRRRWPHVSVGLGLFAVAILPVANLAMTERDTLVAERFLYLPLLGLALIAGCALAAAGRRAYAIAIALALAYAALSVSRAADFADETGLWTREVALHPGSAPGLTIVIGDRVARATAARLQQLAATARDDAELGTGAAEILAAGTPDADTDTLARIDAFCAELVAHETPTAVLAVRDVGLEVATDPARIAPHLPRLLALRAELAIRRDDDPGAHPLSSAALAACPTCDRTIRVAALFAAVIGDFPRALALAGTNAPLVAQLTRANTTARQAAAAQGPAQLEARASVLRTLGLWGRAYHVLAPYLGNIVAAGGPRTGIAELAFRAGDTTRAVELLGDTVPPEQIEPLLVGWATKLGWL